MPDCRFCASCANSPHRPVVPGFVISSDRLSFSLGNRWVYACFMVCRACGVPMTDRAEDFRREAARYLALAKTTIDLKARKELIIMAAQLHNLANSMPADFGIVRQALNDQQTASSVPELVAQQ